MGTMLMQKIKFRKSETDPEEFWEAVGKAAECFEISLKSRKRLAQKILRNSERQFKFFGANYFSYFIVASKSPELHRALLEVEELERNNLWLNERLVFEDECPIFVEFSKLWSDTASDLDLKDNSQIPAKFFVEISANLPNLTSVNFSGTQFNLRDLPKILASCPQLESVNASRCQITDDTVGFVTSEILNLNFKLKKIRGVRLSRIDRCQSDVIFNLAFFGRVERLWDRIFPRISPDFIRGTCS
eukprot:TRINITY_DN4528_c2_g1_i1.p1 TRINITY_DN4528_c2_g1~~TRINITY_DN4528_c2_g1_i1.p1  ORF type:complete len:245 (+),score=88.26 TRINITY_DN4528_c2_g1_i1:482-1216(+)